MLSSKKRRKIRGKFPDVFRENFPEFLGNFLPKFFEISWIFNFLKDKFRAVTCVSSPENAGKSGGKFPGIFPEKISRHFHEFPEISEFPEFSEISRENLTKMKYYATIENKFSAVSLRCMLLQSKMGEFSLLCSETEEC
jgi:hypothetical protein